MLSFKFKMIQKIVDKNGKLSRGDILDFQEEIRRVTFIKKHINEALAALLSSE